MLDVELPRRGQQKLGGKTVVSATSVWMYTGCVEVDWKYWREVPEEPALGHRWRWVVVQRVILVRVD